MDGINQFDSHHPPLNQKSRSETNCIPDNSLLYLFVGYVAAHERDIHTPEEIRECVQILQRKTISTTLTPFQKVVRKKLNRLLPILLACNEDVNFVHSHGQTILHIFAHIYTDRTVFPQTDSFRDREIVTTLLARGASVDVVDIAQNTPIHYAAINQRTDLVLLMLNHFTNVNAQNREMNTILHILVANYNNQPNDLDLEAIRTLVSIDADFITPINKLRMSPFQIAIKHCLIKVLLIFKMKFDYKKDWLFNVCKYAADWSDHPEELQHLGSLVNLNKSVHSRSKVRSTPLHLVAKFGRKNAVELFLSAGADIDATTVDGVTPLHLAVMEGQWEIAKLLIERGANLFARDAVFDFGLMHMSTFKGNRDIIHLLIEKGLDVEDKSRDGLTPLHLAAMRGDDWTIKHLISHGADVNDRTRQRQWSPLHLVITTQSCVDLIENYDSQRLSVIYPYFNNLTKSRLNPVNSLSLLLQADANVNARDYQFRTPLHCAVSYSESIRNTDCVSILFEYGAHVDVRDKNGKTPLCMAYLQEPCLPAPASCKLLLRYGADIDCVDISRLRQFGSDDYVYNNTGNYGLIRHKTLLQALNDAHITRSQRLFPLHELPRHIREIQEKLENEVAKMKAHHLTDGETSLYDFLHMNSRQRLNFAENVLSLDLEKEYPLYHVVIENRCRRAINENLIMSLASSALNRLVQFNLPDTCTDIIFGFMDTFDMTFFIHSVDSLIF